MRGRFSGQLYLSCEVRAVDVLIKWSESNAFMSSLTVPASFVDKGCITKTFSGQIDKAMEGSARHYNLWLCQSAAEVGVMLSWLNDICSLKFYIDSDRCYL